MGARYEVWLCDDAGRRLALLDRISYVSYARAVKGFGYIELGIPLAEMQRVAPRIFNPDWRLDVWRSPQDGTPARREKSFLLRKYNIHTREDAVEMLTLYGRTASDILRRQYINESEDTTFTDFADDMMKQLVTDYLLGATAGYETVPSGEFTVDGDVGAGPSITKSFSLNNLLDALKAIQEETEARHFEDSTENKIYFDVVENETLVTNGFGYTFRTFSGLIGADRTKGIVFSVENGNMKAPTYYEDYNDKITVQDVINNTNTATNATAESPDRYLSRWNTIRAAETSSVKDASANLGKAYSSLQNGAAEKRLNVKFVNSPGGQQQPRSLYGVDWDLGDLLPVRYAGKTFNAEVMVVYVAFNENGQENITGLNVLGE